MRSQRDDAIAAAQSLENSYQQMKIAYDNMVLVNARNEATAKRLLALHGINCRFGFGN